jgi:hypothetical protein
VKIAFFKKRQNVVNPSARLPLPDTQIGVADPFVSPATAGKRSLRIVEKYERQRDLLHIVLALPTARRFARRLYRRQKQRNEQPNDRHRDEQFDQREAAPTSSWGLNRHVRFSRYKWRSSPLAATAGR